MLPISAYIVYWDAGYLLDFVKLAEVDSYDHYFFEAEFLTPGVFYSFKVTAVNQVGESLVSQVVSHYAQSVPGKP